MSYSPPPNLRFLEIWGWQEGVFRKANQKHRCVTKNQSQGIPSDDDWHRDQKE